MPHTENYYIATDFDGTLCNEIKFPGIGSPKPLLKILIDLKHDLPNLKIILWTNRTGSSLEAAKQWCKDQGLEIDRVNENHPDVFTWLHSDPRKVFANLFLDDRAFGYREPSYEELRALIEGGERIIDTKA